MGPSLGNALFVFDAGLLYFVIDSLFGGSGAHRRDEGRAGTSRRPSSG